MKAKHFFTFIGLISICISTSAQVAFTTTSYSNSFSGAVVNGNGQSWMRNGNGVVMFSQNNALTTSFTPYQAWDEIDNVFTNTINITSNPILSVSLKGNLPVGTYLYAFIVDQTGTRTNAGLPVLKIIPTNNEYTVYSFDFSLSSIKGNTSLSTIKKIRFILTNAQGSTSPNGINGSITFGSISLGTSLVSTNPFLTLQGSLTPYQSVSGQQSLSQMLNVSASGLTGNVLISIPSGFVISTAENGAYSSTLTLTPVNGTLASTPVYIRLGNNAVGAYSGNVTFSSAGVSTVSIPTSGQTSSPFSTFQLSPSSLASFNSTLELPSAFQEIIINANGLTSPATVTAPAHFEVSTSNQWGVSNLLLTPTNGSLSNVKIYVRYVPLSVGAHVGSLTLVSGTANASVFLQGNATQAETWKVYGTKMYNTASEFIGVGLAKGEEAPLSTPYYKMTIKGRTNIIGNNNAFEVWSATTSSSGFRHYVAVNNLAFSNGTEYSSMSAAEYNNVLSTANPKHLILNNSDNNGKVGNVGIGNFDSAPTHKLTVKGSTYVETLSIGTVCLPSDAKLAVNGRIKARGLNLETATWCDFVFSPDYELMPIAQLEIYIKKHQHLPEIPAAKDAIQKGMDIVEMNLTLLKKVEELSLYIIELNRQLNKTQQEVKQLQLKIAE